MMNYVYKNKNNRAGTYHAYATEWCESEKFENYSNWSDSILDGAHEICEYGVIKAHDLGLIKASSRDDAMKQAKALVPPLFDCRVYFCCKRGE